MDAWDVLIELSVKVSCPIEEPDAAVIDSPKVPPLAIARLSVPLILPSTSNLSVGTVVESSVFNIATLEDLINMWLFWLSESFLFSIV